MNKNVDYDSLLNRWHDKVINKADKYSKRLEEVEIGSSDYFKYRSYSDGLYMALAMLSNEERKAKRTLNIEEGSDNMDKDKFIKFLKEKSVQIVNTAPEHIFENPECVAYIKGGTDIMEELISQIEDCKFDNKVNTIKELMRGDDIEIINSIKDYIPIERQDIWSWICYLENQIK